mgnify:CR=1 FL=1
MAVLVIAEHNHAALNPAVYSLVTAAQKIGGDIDIMITAQDGGKLAEEAAKINGIRRVLLSEAPYFAEELPENLGASCSSPIPPVKLPLRELLPSWMLLRFPKLLRSLTPRRLNVRSMPVLLLKPSVRSTPKLF